MEFTGNLADINRSSGEIPATTNTDALPNIGAFTITETTPVPGLQLFGSVAGPGSPVPERQPIEPVGGSGKLLGTIPATPDNDALPDIGALTLTEATHVLVSQPFGPAAGPGAPASERQPVGLVGAPGATALEQQPVGFVGAPGAPAPEQQPEGLVGALGIKLGPIGAPDLVRQISRMVEDRFSLVDIVRVLDENPYSDELTMVERTRLLQLSQRENMHDVILYFKKRFTMASVYLGVQYERFGCSDVDLVIYQEPLNTTGDMYHLLGFLALSHAMKYSIPKIVLTYEINESHSTSLPYGRSMGFLKALELADVDDSVPNELEQGSRASSNSRRMATRESISGAKPGGCHIMDQKVVTQILADQFLKSGRQEVSEKIRLELLRRLDAFILTLPQPVQDDIGRFVPSPKQLQQKVVVLHRRLTYDFVGRNKCQDLSDNEANSISSLLTSKGYRVITVLLSDMKIVKGAKLYEFQPFHLRHRVPVGAFAGPLPDWATHLVDNDNKVDMGKIFHLALFVRCFQIMGPLNVIGNTSGTTDIVGLLGHNVLNVHKFADKMNYLSYRIVLQSSFLTIFNKSFLNSTNIEFIVEWCQGNRLLPPMGIPQPSSFSSMALTKSGELHTDFVSLCAIEWVRQYQNNKLELLVNTEVLFSQLIANNIWI